MSKKRLIGVVIVAPIAIYVWINLYEILLALPLDSVREMSRALIQFVSFLTAGWIAGFFYFYRGLREELQRARTLFENNMDTIERGFKRTDSLQRQVKSLADVKGIPFVALSPYPPAPIRDRADKMKKMMDPILNGMSNQIGTSFKVAVVTFVCLGLAVTLSIIGIISGGGYVFLSVSTVVLAILLILYSLSGVKRTMEFHSKSLGEASASFLLLSRTIEEGIDQLESSIELVKVRPTVLPSSSSARLGATPSPQPP